jgi:hypothetical protein
VKAARRSLSAKACRRNALSHRLFWRRSAPPAEPPKN